MRANVITLVVLLAGWLAVAVCLVLHPSLVDWTPVKIVGAAVAGVSLGLLVVARLQLGGAFSVKAKASKLVTTGLYAKIRNPIYVFGELVLVGMAMVLERWILLVPLAALGAVQLLRARKEEAVLAAAFGEEYARYKAGTWF